jgi:hypothetical protein
VWETFEPVVEMIRMKTGNPYIYDNFEYLYRAMRSRTPVNYLECARAPILFVPYSFLHFHIIQCVR